LESPRPFRRGDGAQRPHRPTDGSWIIQRETSNETNRDDNGSYLLNSGVARNGANDADKHFEVKFNGDPSNQNNRKFNSQTHGEPSNQNNRKFNSQTHGETRPLLGRHGEMAAAGWGRKGREDWRRA